MPEIRHTFISAGDR